MKVWKVRSLKSSSSFYLADYVLSQVLSNKSLPESNYLEVRSSGFECPVKNISVL